MKTIAIANHKGGVGKTASAHALGAGLAQLGYRVLLVDVDPQSSLTNACGVKVPGESLAEVFGSSEPGKLALADIIYDVGEEDKLPLHLAPSDIALATNEPGLINRYGRENILKNALATVATDYDVCLIDCPPSLGILTINALSAAQVVLIPTQPQIADMRGLQLFLDTLDAITKRGGINPHLKVLGVLVTFMDDRLLHHRDALKVMTDSGFPLLQTQVGRSVKVAEAAASGSSIITYDPSNRQAENYLALAKEVDTWLRKERR